MRSRYIFDSSFLSSLYYETDVNHGEALRVFASLWEKSQFFIPATIYIEILVGLKRFSWFQPESFYKFLSLINFELIFIDDKFLRGYEKFLNKGRFTLKAIDSTVLFAAEENQAGILTFDKKLLKHSKQRYKL